jgi:hypothetical protein
VRTAEDPAAVDRVGAALQLLAAAHTGRRSPVPQVLLRRPDGTIDVYLRDRVANPTPPWTSNTDGQIWTLPAAAVATKPDRPPPCPALIQLGTTDDDAELYVDLEALGVLAIDAGGAELRAIARAVTATLTLSPLAELVRLRTTGFDPYGLATEERLTAEPTIADLLTHAADDLAPTTTGLTQGGHPTTFALRRADTGENWEPTIAVVGQPLTAADAARLGELAGAGGRGLAVIAAGPGLPARWHLTLQPATDADAQRSPAAPRWRLDPLGLALRPIQLAADELADLTALLATAAAPATDPSPAADRRPQTTTAETAADHTDQPNTAAATPARRVRTGREWTVMVRLLGTVEITDRDGRRPPPPVRDRTLEVLAWLVTHRGGSRAELEAALWPDGASPNTVMNELSRARRILRELAGPAAGDWLPTRQLTLDPAVTSDLDLLRRHLTTADRYADQPDRAIEALTAGLDLVRGVPAGYPWLDAEIGSTLTTLPVTAAVRLAELHLQRGDTDHAQAATDRGLTVLPAHTELFAVRIRIAAATAGRAAVTAEYQAYLRAERADPFYDGETDRDLRQLYQQLLRTSHRQREPDNATAQAG